MRITRFETETEEHSVAKFVFREHTSDCELHHLGRMAIAHLLERRLMKSTHKLGMRPVEFVVFFVAGDDDLVRIEDDDVVAIVDMVCVVDFVLTGDEACDECRDTSERLALGVDAVPLPIETGNLLRLDSFHKKRKVKRR